MYAFKNSRYWPVDRSILNDKDFIVNTLFRNNGNTIKVFKNIFYILKMKLMK